MNSIIESPVVAVFITGLCSGIGAVILYTYRIFTRLSHIEDNQRRSMATIRHMNTRLTGLSEDYKRHNLNYREPVYEYEEGL